MNTNIWNIMAPAFFECLILVGIHSYLGLHVIRRKVIFVDLALAQIAALGTTVGFLFEIMPGSGGSYAFSLLFTFLGAAVFSIFRFRKEKIPQEAVIGLTYAIAAAISILVIDKAPHGAEHIKEILTGSILWVKWKTIAYAALVYTLVGIFHFIYRNKFLLISENPEKAYEQGINIRFWDFLFYVSFGIVITHSVGTAGVLLVFVFLVVPAVASIMITDILKYQLIIGWSLGVTASIFGLLLSYYADLPAGPTVVSFYGLMLILIALIVFIKNSGSVIKAFGKIFAGVVIVALIIFSFGTLGNYLKKTAHHHLADPERTGGKEIVYAPNSPHSNFKSISELEDYLRSVNSVSDLTKLYYRYEEDAIKLSICEHISDLDCRQGVILMLDLLKNTEIPFIREKLIKRINDLTGLSVRYNAMLPAKKNGNAIDQISAWISKRK